ncbi:MAG: transcription antitermination factor NusB [Treponema sp.]|uniref:transcription antitermination factor NusB n=1 Tax=Treponema sp. TaxID=166 RepID=UPI001D4664EA|nr:transcription antitermination factor NusB [Treponema sp.]MBS7309803.1 transcription antitermination factor NusB [Treponema sp.]MCI5696029.1 transcription antitermination factor NusB [Spirochaetia bacterium]MDD5812094.1 transcription antitermination factor NusB [Treponema sp.]
MSRRKSRIIAFQAIYSWDVSGESLDNLTQFSWVDSKENLDESELTFSRLLIAGTIENIEKVDELIKSHLSENWSFDRLNKVTLSILRISIYSLVFQKEIAPSIVIDEAISIAKEFGPQDSFKFINAMLDKISKEQ